MNNDIMKVNQSAGMLVSTETEYAEFISVLRDIRKSYQISQLEMADLLHVTQGAISKFESLSMMVKLDFLISYVHTLGYNIDVDSSGANELIRFRKRFVQTSKELAEMDQQRLDFIYMDHCSKTNSHPVSILRTRKGLIKKLLAAKNDFIRRKSELLKARSQYSQKMQKPLHVPPDMQEELTTKTLSKKLRVSERALIRFECGDNALPVSAVFEYADSVEANLRLIPALQIPEETYVSFYIRNYVSLHNTKRKIENLREAVKLLTLREDKHAEFILVLRNIRESYQISQKEMAFFLNTSQSTISKFEAMVLDVKIEFLIAYARIFGYNIVAAEPLADSEMIRFRIRQRQISKELSRAMNQYSSEPMSYDFTTSLEMDIDHSKEKIRQDLLTAKHVLNIERFTKFKVCVDLSNEYQRDLFYLFFGDTMEEITDEFISQRIETSEKTVRRFENKDAFEAMTRVVFKYASLMNRDLILEPALLSPEESLHSFYIRNCLALHRKVSNCGKKASCSGSFSGIHLL